MSPKEQQSMGFAVCLQMQLISGDILKWKT